MEIQHAREYEQKLSAARESMMLRAYERDLERVRQEEREAAKASKERELRRLKR